MIFIKTRRFLSIFRDFENQKFPDGIFAQKSLGKIIFIFLSSAIIFRSLAAGGALGGR
jgi:hypothetical protein